MGRMLGMIRELVSVFLQAETETMGRVFASDLGTLQEKFFFFVRESFGVGWS